MIWWTLTLNQLYLIEILHQTTTIAVKGASLLRCILSKFYIKPQLMTWTLTVCEVVSYRNSTSNHNRRLTLRLFLALYLIEILHQTTTIWTPLRCILALYLIEILHQTTTLSDFRSHYCGCILSKFYIKPQPEGGPGVPRPCCILSKFYIKPQQSGLSRTLPAGCILSKFYIKPQLSKGYISPAYGCILSKFYIKPQRTCGRPQERKSCILSKFYIKPQLFT